MLKLTNVYKSYGGVKALQGVDLEVKGGEIHALLGENGAGKSTLMKVISGAIAYDSGNISFINKEVKTNNPHISKELGISIIYQEFSLIPDLTVAENIFFGNNTYKWIKWEQLYKEARELIQSLGFDIDVRKITSELSIAQQQIVEIAKALSKSIKLLILDEPSAVLGSEEIKKLFTLLKKLKEKGIGIIYISHHLEELIELTDQVTILKDGKTIGTVRTADVNKDILISMMVGRELNQLYPVKNPTFKFDNPIEIKGFNSKHFNSPLNFKVYKGEILGIGGLVGSSRTEILQSLFGNFPIDEGTIEVDNTSFKPTNISSMLTRGWGMVQEDRKALGGVLERSIKENISLANLKKVSNRYGFINPNKEKLVLDELITRLKIKMGNAEDNLSSLSGGNQQKVILAKWLNRELRVLLIDEPTRGVDVGARYEIYQILQNLAYSGVYIIMVSSDMEELLGISDRIMIMKSGTISGILERKNFSEESLLRMAIGAN
ncbi:MAG: sugar ABC transporter ATP-binding protein [Sphingobacterium composti]|uniref:sugar ABC transporter ATP-binding protein n=1 Tax=Sphingobacterium composti TaxID=363260 RepID=UPI00135B0007|nr:sugar ABC transporter ATP-binding protein [Sphingobacterium composti Ten et al. 2007 non Yoo et al. 2007]